MTKKLEDLTQNARRLDIEDPLALYKKEFSRPANRKADFRGNSLGFMPKRFPELLEREAKKWAIHGHDGHFVGDEPWWLFHEHFEKPLANLLGCNGSVPEVAIGGTLSANNVNLLTLFLRKGLNTNGKKKIFTTRSFFPSDLKSIEYTLWLVTGQSNVQDLIVYAEPDANGLYDNEAIVEQIRSRDDIAIGFFEAINYKTGQRFALADFAVALHEQDAYIGADLAHGIGNIELRLFEWQIDFATFCTYKYLNAGPGAVGGFYIRQDHIDTLTEYVPGWWGIKKDARFGDPEKFKPAQGVRRFLASNDQIFNSLGLLAQLELFNEYSFKSVVKKHKKISVYMYDLLDLVPGVQVITPENWNKRGCQISFKLAGKDANDVLRILESAKCFCEVRGDVLRATPVAYNTYQEVATFAKILATV